jgi:hypothetical protein
MVENGVDVSKVVFGQKPVREGRQNSAEYDAIEQELRANPGDWGLIAVVYDKKDIERWKGVGRVRGWKISQRLHREGDRWDIWAMWPPQPR